VISGEFGPCRRGSSILSISLKFPAFPRRKKVNSVEYAESEGQEPAPCDTTVERRALSVAKKKKAAGKKKR
jgi:hypothetical protein